MQTYEREGVRVPGRRPTHVRESSLTRKEDEDRHDGWPDSKSGVYIFRDGSDGHAERRRGKCLDCCNSQKLDHPGRMRSAMYAPR